MTRSLRFILLTALPLLAMQSFAQTPLESLRKMFSSGAVTIEAEYEMLVQQVPVTGISELLVQSDKYTMKGNGLEVYCNGEDVWTIDESSREVVIEPCDGMYDVYAVNPVLLLADLDVFFEMKSQKRIGNDTEYVFEAAKDCGISQAVVLLAADGSIITGKFILQDGSAVFVKVKSLKKTEERNSSFFSPSRKFGSDWVVTDLR